MHRSQLGTIGQVKERWSTASEDQFPATDQCDMDVTGTAFLAGTTSSGQMM